MSVLLSWGTLYFLRPSVWGLRVGEWPVPPAVSLRVEVHARGGAGGVGGDPSLPGVDAGVRHEFYPYPTRRLG